ncbi:MULTISPECIES: helix-turn-helix domain-containing protein [Actinoalloteichus]|uniref:Transcriptional regulator, XRE family with cupin sensor n=1 Tax=Actinoalloteichus fjordicus TaxID=1612552 RepID=A0AAC9L9F5_9PSEU|nr:MULTISPECIES: XRE family transcriptional regulator [Actinoalloteichus]APU12224.1 transcriptional regulator, XRE family with cupin sensor [Actinoalloteichus fjordicus]APU18176.1 transcriptional regulator, XRE family with cupin sensor [Actinoalloteichus sp. GBA129-24]
MSVDVSEQALAGLGARVRGLRTRRGLSRSQLAARSGLSEPHLSRLENGERLPSLHMLARLAAGLDVSLAELLTDQPPGPAAVVMRGDSVPTVSAGGLSTQVLTPRSVVPGMYATRYQLEPSAETTDLLIHDGNDWIYVLSGALLIDFGTDSISLAPGDSVSFSSRVPHRLRAENGRPVDFLAIGHTLTS